MESAVQAAITAMHSTKAFLVVAPPLPSRNQVQLLQDLQKECSQLQTKTQTMLDALKNASLWDANVVLVVLMVSGERIELSVKPNASVALIKRKIEEKRGIPVSDMVGSCTHTPIHYWYIPYTHTPIHPYTYALTLLPRTTPLSYNSSYSSPSDLGLVRR
jgi:hypothetical protein